VTAVAGASGRPQLIGARGPRREDRRLLRGDGMWIADVRRPRMVDACFVRSQLAHALVAGLELEAARGEEGVVAVVSGADLEGVSAVPDDHPLARPVRAHALARDRVRYVGAPLAVVVAEDRYLGEDAAELIEVDLEPLPVAASLDEALAPGAPLLYPEWPDNRLVEVPASNPATDQAFKSLTVVSGSYVVQRQAAVPIETRGVVAEHRDGRLTVWTSTQYPHIVRTMISRVLGLPELEIRVIAPDVGGAFGGKAQIYPEEYVVPWLALRLGRPVRWIEDRSEHMVASCQARDVRIELEAAVRDDGTVAALRGRVLQDLGSGEIYPPGFSPGLVTVGALTGPYRIPHQAISMVGVVTNKTPSGAYRGFGYPEATFAMERLIDRIGRQLELDPVDVRRRMIIEPSELPYETASGALIDSGSHREAFERALVVGERLIHETRERHAARADVRVGKGIACYVEGTAASYRFTSARWTTQESCDVTFDPGGGATVAVGVSTAGQGLVTMVATIAAEILGLPMERVRVVMGDTDTTPYGLGGFASRSTVVAAGAIERAAGEVLRKGRRIAAHLLEAAEQDLEVQDGCFHVRGSAEASVPWSAVARTALIDTVDLPADVEPGLRAHAVYVPPGIEHEPDALGRLNANPTYTNATHVAVVTVDIATGIVKVEGYGVVHDCGRVINPVVVAGQVHGGVAQGIGGALYEHLVYDELGQPTSTTFMDYLLPTASEIPTIHHQELESPAPNIPFGVKGVGEAGVIGPGAAIAAAVEDALREFDPPEIAATPILPDEVRQIVLRGAA
jgi:aerobic carbon-monoxide dehydrogenase large subunit